MEGRKKNSEREKRGKTKRVVRRRERKGKKWNEGTGEYDRGRKLREREEKGGMGVKEMERKGREETRDVMKEGKGTVREKINPGMGGKKGCYERTREKGD